MNQEASVRAFWMGGMIGALSVIVLFIGWLAHMVGHPAVFYLCCVAAVVLFCAGTIQLVLGLWARKFAAGLAKSNLPYCRTCQCSREEITPTDKTASDWQPCTIVDETGAAVKGWEQRVSCIENWKCPSCQSVVARTRQWSVRKKGNHPELRETGSAGGGTTYGQ